MLVCNCTLPYSNPEACQNCLVYKQYYSQFEFDTSVFFIPEPPKKLFKPVKLINKNFKDDNYVNFSGISYSGPGEIV